MAKMLRGVIWLTIASSVLRYTSSQMLDLGSSYPNNGLCRTIFCNSLKCLRQLSNCVVVLGNLNVNLLENVNKKDFKNLSYPVREVTGLVSFFRVYGLESISQIFPNLTRIHGQELLRNYALILFDMPHLTQIGLKNLLKIDRGSVTTMATPLLCHVDTVDWGSIAPIARNIFSPPGKQAHCNSTCRCSEDPRYDTCWNKIHCQRFLTGPHSEKCNEQCLGCRKDDSNACSLCRHYTYSRKCVPNCPNGTIILQANNYCISEKQCYELGGILFNQTCVLSCPIGYEARYSSNRTGFCQECSNECNLCDSLHISSIESVQSAGNCVHVNGSLTICLRDVAGAMEELQYYLSRIKEVRDYIWIFGSLTISSLEFLSSLETIGGHNLKYGKYSILIHNMKNLSSLFSDNVLQNLKVMDGTLSFYANPILCLSTIEKLVPLFSKPYYPTDIPEAMNGYSGNCSEISEGLQIRVENETSALIMLSPAAHSETQLYLIYSQLPPKDFPRVGPEICSNLKWNILPVVTKPREIIAVRISSLLPASSYALCVESLNTARQNLVRTSMFYFQTFLGKPVSPFITKLTALNEHEVILRWVDHETYSKHITHYILEVNIIDIEPERALLRNHCLFAEQQNSNGNYHNIEMRPPHGYIPSCASKCGALSVLRNEELKEESFELHEIYLDSHELYKSAQNNVQTNSSEGFVRNLVLFLKSPLNSHQVGHLAPYRDYRFLLRSCINTSCSDIAQEVIKTLPSVIGDRAGVNKVTADSTGNITISWQTPIIVNGLILTYLIQVIPGNLNVSHLGEFIPPTWCVLSNVYSLFVQTEQHAEYSVRICTTSLWSSGTCGDWVTVKPESHLLIYRTAPWYYSGIIVGLVLWLSSLIIVWYFRRNISAIEFQPLIESTAIYRTSEASYDLQLFNDLVISANDSSSGGM